MANNTHSFKFFRVGGVEQVLLRSGADLMNLAQLDQKLWVALACPVKGLELDPRTLELIDADKDGRIRAPEFLAAIKWVGEVLKNPDDLFKGGDSVVLAAIKDEALRAGAQRILDNLGKGQSAAISLADVADTARIFANTHLNGDGVVPAEAAGDAELQKVLEDIIATHGSAADRSGKPGVNQALVEAFFKDVSAVCDWHKKADAGLLPLGSGTAAAAAAVAAVKVKVEDYFARCRLAAFDPRAAARLNRDEGEYAALAMKDLTAAAEDIAKLPLHRIEAGRPLPMSDGLNPAWAGAVGELARVAVGPLLGTPRTSLNEADWQQVVGKLAGYVAWQAEKPASKVEGLGLDRLGSLVAGGFEARLLELIKQDEALAAENAQIEAVEKLVRLQRDLVILANNFVNFSEFYGRKGAIFQAGTLYLDGRSCDLCVRVEDGGKHAALAGLAKSYLAYCDCTRGAEKMSIVAAFTNGDSDNLLVGRNGLFYDRKGQDWDATITKIVENPISVREAFWSPYKRFVRLVEEQVAKRAAAADAESTTRVNQAATQAASADQTKEAPKAGDKEKKMDIGTVAAVGVAIGGIGAFITAIVGYFVGLGPWLPVGVLGLVLAISAPSMLIAWLKLRQRNLGPILDANGWAINGRARINVPFGSVLTSVAHLPKGAEHALADPYADKRSPWRFYLFLALVLALGATWYVGKLDGFLPNVARSVTVLGENAPAYKAPEKPSDKPAEKK